MSAIIVRAATGEDIPAIQAIYAEHVETGFGSFEIEPPDLAEMARRFETLRQGNYPYLVAADGEGTILGFAYAAAYRPRAAYRYTVEDSIYVASAMNGRGIGRALLDRLIEQATALGFREMVAVIGDSRNAGSIGVHRACGFRLAGTLERVGFKLDRWLDVVLMQRSLG